MSITTEVNSIMQNIGNAYDGLEDLGIDLTDVDKNINNISSMLENVWDEYPKVTATDVEEATLNGTKKGRMEIDLKGNKAQEQLQGINLVPMNRPSFTLSGVTITNKGNSLVLNGTKNSGSGDYITLNFSKTLKANTDYTLAIELLNGSVTDIPSVANITIGTSTNANYRYMSITNLTTKGQIKASRFKPSEDVKIKGFYLYYGGSSNPVFTNYEIRVWLVEGNYTTETMPAYEPYCGGIPSPNPDFPQQIKNVTGSANVKIQNKNLFDKDNASTMVGYFSADGRINYGGSSTIITSYSEIKPNTNMIVSGCPIEAICFYDKNKNFIERSFISANVSFNKNAYFIRLQAPTNTFDINKLQLEQGTTATDFVPHQEQNLPFTFAQSQRAMQGTTLEDDGFHQTWDEYIFTGEENWVDYRGTQTGDFYKFYTTGVKLGRSNSMEAKANAYCTHFINNNFYANDNGIGLTQNAIYISIDKTIASTPNELKTFFATQYNNANPVKVQYIRRTPLTINYVGTQQEQYNAIKQARSYDDQTNISSTSDELGFKMDVEILSNGVSSSNTRTLALGSLNQGSLNNIKEVDTEDTEDETSVESEE